MPDRLPLKAFISHASEDKERFVLDFGRRLLADGVDAWVDRWEMAPGDSLIRRIFDEGIDEADAFVMVISTHSIEKPWVREELDAAVIRRIEGSCRIIPVVLDAVAVPPVLMATVWQAIDDPTNYDDEYQRVLDAICGVSAKPPLGPPPRYTSSAPVQGLNQADSHVLAALCEQAISSASMHVGGEPLTTELRDAGLGGDALLESLLALEQTGMVEEVRLVHGRQVMYVKLDWSGLLRYLAHTYPDLGSKQQALLAHLVNDDSSQWDLVDLAEYLGVPRLVTEAVLVPYESRAMLRIDRFLGNHTMVRSVSPLWKRELS